jgi:dTDP-4-amino-4,6-dideoxygalactose transaminase
MTIGVGTFHATNYMRSLISEVLDSGRISYGPLSLEFEQRFSALHGCRYGILANSGTSALQVALQALKEVRHWHDGDRVIVPATTFVASANVVLHNRMVPTFVDVDSQTYNINPELIEKAITPETRAIMAVHLFGQAADMTAIREIAARHNLAIIEDSCETVLATHRGRSVGSLSDVAAFSFYVAHILVTGVGGMATTNDPALAAKMRSLVNHGMELACLNPGENFAPRPAPGRRFRFETTGHSYRITELEVALGLAQLDDLPHTIQVRQRNARQLVQGLQNINAHYRDAFQTPVIAEGNTHSFMMFPIVLKQGDKEDLIRHLLESGVEVRDMLPLINQPAFWYLQRGAYPVSANLIDNGLYIGCHQDLTTDDISNVADVFGLWTDGAYQSLPRMHKLEVSA